MPLLWVHLTLWMRPAFPPCPFPVYRARPVGRGLDRIGQAHDLRWPRFHQTETQFSDPRFQRLRGTQLHQLSVNLAVPHTQSGELLLQLRSSPTEIVQLVLLPDVPDTSRGD